MSYSKSQPEGSITINLRAKQKHRDLIDLAAQQQGRSRSDFMLEAACREAENVLLDKAFFAVDSNAFQQFQAMLDAPSPSTDKLKRLLNTDAPWEKNKQ